MIGDKDTCLVCGKKLPRYNYTESNTEDYCHCDIRQCLKHETKQLWGGWRMSEEEIGQYGKPVCPKVDDFLGSIRGLEKRLNFLDTEAMKAVKRIEKLEQREDKETGEESELIKILETFSERHCSWQNKLMDDTRNDIPITPISVLLQEFRKEIRELAIRIYENNNDDLNHMVTKKALEEM